MNVQNITGEWTEGTALDWHYTSKQYVRSESGELHIHKVRPAIAAALHAAKYDGEVSAVVTLFEHSLPIVTSLLNKWQVDLIVPIPPSEYRNVQPVYLYAETIGKHFGLSVLDTLLKSTRSNGLKHVKSKAERREFMRGAFQLRPFTITQKNVLLVDDTFHSGATLSAAAKVISGIRSVANLYVLTITKSPDD